MKLKISADLFFEPHCNKKFPVLATRAVNRYLISKPFINHKGCHLAEEKHAMQFNHPNGGGNVFGIVKNS